MSVRSSTSSDPVHVMKLKHLEMDNLRAEIDTGGIVRTISRVHFQHGLALVECFDKIWLVQQHFLQWTTGTQRGRCRRCRRDVIHM